jgi:hypothetical protein
MKEHFFLLAGAVWTDRTHTISLHSIDNITLSALFVLPNTTTVLACCIGILNLYMSQSMRHPPSMRHGEYLFASLSCSLLVQSAALRSGTPVLFSCTGTVLVFGENARTLCGIVPFRPCNNVCPSIHRPFHSLIRSPTNHPLSFILEKVISFSFTCVTLIISITARGCSDIGLDIIALEGEKHCASHPLSRILPLQASRKAQHI